MLFKSKFLIKKAWENEHFTYFGMEFDIDKAEKIIADHPRSPQKAPKQFLENFVGSVNQDKEEKETGAFSILTVGLNKDHIEKVDENKPGIVAVITFKSSKSHPELSTNYVLIDGNHRAKKRLRMGFDDMDVYILTPEESWEVMAPNTFPGITKNLVNPTKKEIKPRVPRPKSVKPSKGDKQRSDMQSRLDFINQNPVPSRVNLNRYIDKFGDPLWMDDLTEEKEYLEKQLKKKRAYGSHHTSQEVAANKRAWVVGKRGEFHTYIWIYSQKYGLILSDKLKWHSNFNDQDYSYRGILVLNTKYKTGNVLSYFGHTHDDAEFIPNEVWKAFLREFPGYKLTEKQGMGEAVKKDWDSEKGDQRYKNYFLRGLKKELSPYRQFASPKQLNS